MTREEEDTSFEAALLHAQPAQSAEELWRLIKRLQRERDDLRGTLQRQYTRIGDPSGASAPLRAEALKLLVRSLERLNRSWILWDDDVASLNTKAAGSFLADLLEEEVNQRDQ